MKIPFNMKTIFFLFLLSFGSVAFGQEKPAKSSDALPENAPAIGTDINKVITKPSWEREDSEARVLKWDDLVPKGFDADTILRKYEKQIEKIPEGSPAGRDLLVKLMAEFNNAPSNKELHGTTVKIPGFVSPLDEKDGMVTDFLLVPYFGSCIHSPPPPVNQTVLVTPSEGKSIKIEDIYEPVWVTGKISVERADTELAQAGYVIQNAALEVYEVKK